MTEGELRFQGKEAQLVFKRGTDFAMEIWEGTGKDAL